MEMVSPVNKRSRVRGNSGWVSLLSSLPPSYQHALPALLPLGFHRNRKHIQVGYLLLDGKTLGVELFMPAVVAFRSHVHEQMVSLLRKTPRAEDDK